MKDAQRPQNRWAGSVQKVYHSFVAENSYMLCLEIMLMTAERLNQKQKH